MPEEEPRKCLRCGTEMTLDEQLYAVPRSKKFGGPNDGESFIDTNHGRWVDLFLCPNPQCHCVELVSPRTFPKVSL